MDNFSSLNWRPFFANRVFSLVYSTIIILFATGYIVMQWMHGRIILDSLFVSILLAATMLLLIGIRRLANYLIHRGLDIFLVQPETATSTNPLLRYHSFCRTVFNSHRMFIVGIVYGLLICSSPIILGVWHHDHMIQLWLVLFLFAANFVTGIGFYSLVSFFYQALSLGKNIPISLWNRSNPALEFILGATRRITLLASFYISLSITSIVFSLFTFGSLVIGYAFFATIILLASLFIPTWPIAKRMRLEKTNALRELEGQLEYNFNQILNKMKSGPSSNDIAQVDQLLQLREKIEAASTWPFRSKSFSAALSIIILSSIPVLLQIILEKLTK